MNRSEVVKVIAESTGQKAAVVEQMIDAFTDTVLNAASRGDAVNIPGFGKFQPKVSQARSVRNLSTGANIQIPERTSLKFKASTKVQEFLTGK